MHYDSKITADGVHLHIISSEEAWADQVSVTVAVGFGSAHLACRDSCGNIYELPQGMAHFMEHLLYWLNFQEILSPFSHKYIAEPNAVVTDDLTRWGASGALVDDIQFHHTTPTDENRRIESVGDVVRSLLLVLIPDDEAKERIDELLINRTVNDIGNEIGERHSGFIPHGNHDVNSMHDYVMKLKLMENLYLCNPVRYDPLGTQQSLRTIKMNHIELALRLIRHNVRSITISGWRLSERLITHVEQIVLDLLNRQYRSEKLYPVTDVAEPLTTCKRVDSIENKLLGDYALALVGIKLLPLHKAFSSLEELQRMRFITFLMMNRGLLNKKINRSMKDRVRSSDISAIISSVSSVSNNNNQIIPPVQIMISQHTRTYFVKGKVDNPLRLVLDPLQCTQIMTAYKTRLIDKLHAYQNVFDEEIEKMYTEITNRPHALMKLCNFADLFDCKVTELLALFQQISSVELNTFITELQASKNMTLVYAVRDLSFFEQFSI